MRAWVFAYGSNMHLEDVDRWLVEQGYAPWGAAEAVRARPCVLADYALVWDYRSVARRGGAANIEPKPGHELPGLVVHLDDQQLGQLDEKEGHTYERKQRPVRIVTGDARRNPEQELVQAWVYEVLPAHRQPEPVWPRAEYLELLISASERWGFPDEHLASLRATPIAESSSGS